MSHTVSHLLKLLSNHSKENIPIDNVIEIIAYCHFDGKIEQKSRFETNLCNDLLDQLKSNNDLTERSVALCWIYLKICGEFTKARPS